VVFFWARATGGVPQIAAAPGRLRLDRGRRRLRYDASDMAQIRIVDDWRRSPGSGPSHYRSVMVIAEKWAEQRVLMRAYAESRDPLRPTIMLHGTELAIGPAGLDLNGPWGIHVGDNPEVRAPHIKEQLESSARRLAGSKGNPPRLADESPALERSETAGGDPGGFAGGAGGRAPRGIDREPTAHWGPGAPRVQPARPSPQPPAVQQVGPIGAARIPAAPAAAYVPPMQAQHAAAPTHAAAAPSNPELRTTPMPRPRSWTARHPPVTHARTALGYTSGSGAQSAIVRLGLAPHVSARLGRLVDRVVPGDFHLDGRERRVLNALGEGELTARGIGQMLDVADPVSFMEELTRKLEAYNLDLVEPGEPQGGEPTYRLRA
jgi:hypothetical protein